MISYDNCNIKLDWHIPQSAIEWRNDPLIFKTCRQYTLLDNKSHDRWLENINSPDKKMFSIFLQLNHDGIYVNEYIGVCGLTNINYQSRHAEISLYIIPKYQGNGYAKETLYTLCKHGFEDFNLNKIWGECFNNNLKSLLLFKKLGFVASSGHIQHYFRNGTYIDTTFMTLLQKDWKNVDQVYCRNIGESQTREDQSSGDDSSC